MFNFKLEFAHRFDRVKQLQNVILRFVGHSNSSDAFPKNNGEKIPMGSYKETGANFAHACSLQCLYTILERTRLVR